MKTKNIAKILMLVLSLALLIGSVVGISVSAEDTATETTTGKILAQSIIYGDKTYVMFAVEGSAADGLTLSYTWANDEEVKTASVYEDVTYEGAVVFVTEGVALYDLGKVVNATSYVNGVEADTRTYSVAQFLYTKLYADGVVGSQADFYNSLLECGANAQTYLGQGSSTLVTNLNYIYTDVEKCTVDGENRCVVFESGDVTVEPTYSGDYTLDYWLVYNAETGMLTRSIEEDGSLERSASFRVHPVFLTDNLEDIATGIELKAYAKLSGESAITEKDYASSEWDAVSWKNKLSTSNKEDSVLSSYFSNTNVVSFSSGGYFCVVPDVRDAANYVLLLGQRAASGYGSYHPTVDVSLGENGVGTVYVAQFDTYMEYTKQGNGIITFSFIDSSGASKEICKLTTASGMTDDISSNPISDKWYAGTENVKFASDTWVTLRMVYCGGTVTCYYSLNDGESFTKYYTSTVTLTEGSTLSKFRIEGNIYNSTSIVMFDDISLNTSESVSTALTDGTADVIAPVATDAATE